MAPEEKLFFLTEWKVGQISKKKDKKIACNGNKIRSSEAQNDIKVSRCVTGCKNSFFMYCSNERKTERKGQRTKGITDGIGIAKASFIYLGLSE